MPRAARRATLSIPSSDPRGTRVALIYYLPNSSRGRANSASLVVESREPRVERPFSTLNSRLWTPSRLRRSPHFGCGGAALGNDVSCRALPGDSSGSASAPREGLGEGLLFSCRSIVLPGDEESAIPAVPWSRDSVFIVSIG